MQQLCSKHRIWFFIYGSLMLVQGSACRKFLQLDPAPTLIETRAVFSSDPGAVSAVMGLYSQMVSSNLSLTNGGSSIYLGLTADELRNNFNPTYDEFKTNAISRTNFSVANIWDNAYRSIYHANALLEGLENATALTDSVKRQLTGEVKFIRAFYYFYLVNYFGAVPLVTSTSYTENAVLPRTASTDIYRQVLLDLKAAAAALPVAYPSNDRVRPNKWAAQALLARVYLYLGDWEQAALAASTVLNSGLYALETDLNNVFLISSTETIWQLMRETSNTAEGTTFIPFSRDALPTLSPTSYLLDAFEPGDRRKAYWLDSSILDGQPYYYPAKYKARGSGVVTEYLVGLRLAEQYLIRAEARAQLNDSAGALADLNTVRNRAGLEDATAGNPATLQEAIAHERQVELFAEWGHRWLDLKRTGQIDAVLGVVKAPGWQPTDTLFPLPQEEIDKNPALTQNPGY